VVLDAVERAKQLEHDEKKAVEGLSQAVENIKSDTMVYKVLITAMLNDSRPDALTPTAIFLNKCVQRVRATPPS
jgi:hypothetical protein